MYRSWNSLMIMKCFFRKYIGHTILLEYLLHCQCINLNKCAPQCNQYSRVAYIHSEPWSSHGCSNYLYIRLINSYIRLRVEGVCMSKLITNNLSLNLGMYLISGGIEGTMALISTIYWSSTHSDSIGRAISPSWWTRLHRITHVETGR